MDGNSKGTGHSNCWTVLVVGIAVGKYLVMNGWVEMIEGRLYPQANFVKVVVSPHYSVEMEEAHFMGTGLGLN